MTHADLVALLNEAADTGAHATDCHVFGANVRGCDCGWSSVATRLRTAADALAGVGITKVQDMDCYEIRYRVSKREVHDYVGADFAGVVGRLVAHKWRTTFDAARAAGEG